MQPGIRAGRAPATLLVLLAACGEPDDDADRPLGDSEGADTEPGGTDVPDTVPGHTDPPDTDPPDTDPPDSDAVDTEPVDTEPVDTDPPEIPADFGGVFVDVTASTWSTWTYDVRNQTAFRVEEVPAAIGDVDDDGVVEVLPSGLVDPASPFDASPVLRLQPDGSWAPDVAAGNAVHGEPAGTILGVVDLDGDGHHDVLRSMASNTLGLGDGNLGFTWLDVGLVDVASRGYAADVMALVDLDRDGWLDVALGGAYACRTGASLSVLWRTGLRTWVEKADLVPASPPVAARVLMPIPLDDGGTMFGVLGADCAGHAAPGFYVPTGARTADGLPRFVAHDPVPANAWMHQVPATAGAFVNALAPMGGAVVDLDADDLFEVLVTIAEQRQLVFRSIGLPDFEDATAAYRLDFPKLVGTTEREAWGAAPLDVDRDGWPDLAIAQGDDWVAASLPVDTRVSYPRLFWNDRQGGLHDVSDVLGLDATVGNWHSLVAGDLDGDLDPDLVVGGYGRPPRIWRNDTVTTNQLLVLRLQGTTSNHLGVGATVRVEAAGAPPQRHFVGGETGSPFVFAEPVLYVGLGAAPVARVEVSWPSGLVQVVEDVPAGVVTLVEPVTVALSEADRHLPADGDAVVDVVVTPRAADGSLRSAVDVDVELASGGGAWVGPVVRDGDTWTRRLRAPASAGSAVVVVTIDGVEVGVRPRVWFD